MKRFIIGTALGLSGLLLGCGSSSGEGACARIAEACHDKDTGTGPAFECHELAEIGEGGDAECAQKEVECTEACAD